MFHPRGPTLAELARQALSSTRRGYDLLAPKFDVTPYRTPGPVLAALRDWLAGPDGTPAGVETAVDWCCGTGAGLEVLRPWVRSRLVGVDFSQGMLREARRRLGRDGSPRLELVCSDVRAPAVDLRADLAIVLGANGHFLREEQRDLFRGMLERLTADGRLALFASVRASPLSRRYWTMAAFDAILYLRNRVRSPPFVMYYRALPCERLVALLDELGACPRVLDPRLAPPHRDKRLVVAGG